jgi:lipid-A-disaccharide synthase
MNYFLIAGEASGDLHGSKLMEALKKQDPQAHFRYFGGDRMEAVAPGGLALHYRKMAYMGITEVIIHLRAITRNLRQCKEEITTFHPDVVILIDYPGFNLRMAEYAHNNGYRVFYYISPKLWAWKQHRVKKIKAFVEKMFIILPFEKDFYRKFGVETEYLGNPVVDEVARQKEKVLSRKELLKKQGLPDRPVIALLPGSRKQELHYNLPAMLNLVKDYPGHQFLIAGAPAFNISDYAPFIKDTDVKVIFDHTYDLLHAAVAALVTSGTATLETALMGVPQVVIYRMNSLTYTIGKHFVNIEFFSLVNLILGKEAVKELLQKEVTPQRIRTELNKILSDTPARQQMIADYRRLQEILGEPGVSQRVAQRMFESLKV